VNRVSTSNSYSAVLANLMSAQARQAQAQAQVSTGKQASDLKGFGQGAEALTAARALQSRVEGYIASNKVLAGRLEAQDLALNQVAGAAGSARAAIASAIASGRADGLNAALESALDAGVQGLNVQFAGRYLFAGGQTAAPAAAANLGDLTAPPAAGLFRNDSLKAVHRIDESTTLETGFLADQVGGTLFDALRQVQAFADGAGGPFSGQLTQAQANFLTGMLSMFDAAQAGVTDKAAQNGLLQNRLDDTRAAQEDRQVMLEKLVGDLSEVDIAEAATRLAQAQTAVQASAQVFATLRDTSLLDLLR
jgi:flagellar hook-associated protein 3 FlgL